jgi:hypothetical protein
VLVLLLEQRRRVLWLLLLLHGFGVGQLSFRTYRVRFGNSVVFEMYRLDANCSESKRQGAWPPN